MDAHLVLGERARLVGTDDSGGTHRLAGMHLAHQIVGLQHLAHAEGKAQGDRHRQSFGHGADHERHGYHDGLEEIGNEFHRVEAGRMEHIEEHSAQHNDDAHQIARLGDEFAQAVELLVERRLHTVVYLCSHEHLAVFGLVTHLEHTENAVSLHHLGFFYKL